MKINLEVNGTLRSADVEADTPLLWVLREELGLSGTKFGCGMALCGACTVMIDGAPVRSCVTPASALQATKITTIEGLEKTPQKALQQAWIEEQVPQCGYCQSGMLMAAAALLRAKPRPSRRDIAVAMTNLCRCGTYPRVERAILSASRRLEQNKSLKTAA